MKSIMHISNSNRIGEILDYIHDLWIDLDRVEYIEAKHELTIPVLKKEKQRTGPILNRGKKYYKEKFLLTINNVNSFIIEDSENVGYYDINTITYDDPTKILVIKTGIPLTFEMIVSNFEMTLIG